MKKSILLTFVCWFIAASANAAIQTREIQYKQGDVQLNGYIAFDDGIEGKRPGVLIIHEWWGHNAYVRKRAEMLAGLGYTAMAVDMYGDGKVADHPDTAGEFSSAVMKDIHGAGKLRFLAALEVLKQQPTVDRDRIAAIGYCFGGGIVLNMARMGFDLDGVVSFHGSLGARVTANPGNIKARILVCHGADDPFVSSEQVAAFKEEMDGLGVDYQINAYPGAVHGFTNPDADANGAKFGLPLAYHEKADKESWQAMQDFFDRIFE